MKELKISLPDRVYERILWGADGDRDTARDIVSESVTDLTNNGYFDEYI